MLNEKLYELKNPFDRWMVGQNLEYVKKEGLEVVVNRLRGQGYNRVANVVENIVNSNKNGG